MLCPVRVLCTQHTLIVIDAVFDFEHAVVMRQQPGHQTCTCRRAGRQWRVSTRYSNTSLDQPINRRCYAVMTVRNRTGLHAVGYKQEDVRSFCGRIHRYSLIEKTVRLIFTQIRQAVQLYEKERRKDRMGYPSVYPTGSTIYDPDHCFNGYTCFRSHEGVALVDMNGNLAHLWKGLEGFPAKPMPGGFVMGSTARRNPKYGYLDMTDLIQVDWDGNVIWKFANYERIQDGRKRQWMARQHHDFQRSGNPVGYYVPGMTPKAFAGSTVILAHKNIEAPHIAPGNILDDTIIDVTWEGEITWEWSFAEHLGEMGFSETALNTMHRNPNIVPAGGGMGD